MSSSAADLRAKFLDPPVQYRHLVIIHSFLNRRRPSETLSWHSPEPESQTDADLHERLLRRLQRTRDWGFGGVVANVGPRNYLEDEEEWRVFLAGVDAAHELGMRLWIYDENGYPSGAAGGIVLRDNPEHEAQSLVRMQQSLDAGPVHMRPPSGWWYAVRAEARFDNGDVAEITGSVDEAGHLEWSCDRPCAVMRYDVRHAFEGTHCTCNVYRARRYINVLSRDAVRRFYDVTGGQYLARLGSNAEHIEAVFTDEPSFMSAYHATLSEEWKQKVPVQDSYSDEFDRLPMIAWDRALPLRFEERYGYSILPRLGSLFAGTGPDDQRLRHDFYALQSEIYADTFFGMQQELLAPHNIAFSGHALCEESLTMHVACQGNLMSNLARMEIPGLDMLCSTPEAIYDSPRLLACKYVSSAAHCAGRRQVMCEASEFEEQVGGRKLSLAHRRGAFAVQMALGVTTMTSYYAWHECDEDERRKTLDFWTRLAVVLRSGTHRAGFAVLYPIRTGWATYRPTDRTLTPEDMDEPLRSMDDSLLAIAQSILRAGLDFDFIDIDGLAKARSDGGKLHLADESYEVLVLPPEAVLSDEDLRVVERFVDDGGRLVAFGPLSNLALEDGGGRPQAVVAQLALRAPDRVLCAKTDDDWLNAALSWLSPDVRVHLSGNRTIARRSVFAGAEFVVVANASPEAASAEVDFGDGHSTELWDPWAAKVTPVAGSHVELTVDGYSAMVAVGMRSGS